MIVQTHKILLAVISASFLLECFASEPRKSATEADLRDFFESIERIGTNIVFTTRKCGARFYYRINGVGGKFNNYGEVITLPEDSELVVAERHHTLIISPVSENKSRKGFHVSLEKDFRSFRGELATNEAYMVYSDEKSDNSDESKGCEVPEGNRVIVKSAGAQGKEAEKKCLKGLKLLPCENINSN